MPKYQLQLQYADGHETSGEHYAPALLRVGELIVVAAEEWRIQQAAPADDWRFAGKLLCRLEAPNG